METETTKRPGPGSRVQITESDDYVLWPDDNNKSFNGTVTGVRYTDHRLIQVEWDDGTVSVIEFPHHRVRLLAAR